MTFRVVVRSSLTAEVRSIWVGDGAGVSSEKKRSNISLSSPSNSVAVAVCSSSSVDVTSALDDDVDGPATQGDMGVVVAGTSGVGGLGGDGFDGEFGCGSGIEGWCVLATRGVEV